MVDFYETVWPRTGLRRAVSLAPNEPDIFSASRKPPLVTSVTAKPLDAYED